MLDAYDDPRITAFGMLLEAHNEAARAVESRMAGTEVTQSFLGVLIRLARSPGHELRMTELAHDMTISTSGLTRLVDRMESAGLVERRDCPEDRRGLNCALTDGGFRVLDDVADDHLAAVDQAVGQHLTARELGQLTNLLRKVRDGNRDS